VAHSVFDTKKEKCKAIYALSGTLNHAIAFKESFILEKVISNLSCCTRGKERREGRARDKGASKEKEGLVYSSPSKWSSVIHTTTSITRSSVLLAFHRQTSI
jgi:hypothetical protein